MVTFGHSHGENLGDGPGDTIGAAGVRVGWERDKSRTDLNKTAAVWMSG